mgnify:FL=1
MAFKFRSRGFNQYIDEAIAQKIREEEKEEKRELLAFEMQMKYGDNFLSSSGSGSAKGKSTPTNIATAALMKEYNLTEEALAPILASGDKTAAGRLLDTLEKQKVKYIDAGLTLPDEVVSGIVESAVITQPTNREIDFTKVEKFIGREMDSLYKDLLKSQSTDPGAVFFPEPGFTPTPDLEDLGRFEKRAVKGNFTRAKDELNKVDNRLSEIISIEENTNLSQNQIAERGWLSSRKSEIERAIKAYNDDIVTPIAGLYGTTYIKKLQESYGTFKDDLIDPELLYASQKNIRVPMEIQQYMLDSLIKSGILREGDVIDIVSEDGEVVNQITVTP